MTSLDRLIKANTIFLGLTGSRAYGVNDEDSDYDYRGACILPDKSYYYGFLKNFEQAEYSKPEDKVIYNFRKLMKLMVDCNPNCIELLYLPDFAIVKTSPVWDKVREQRYRFLSKAARWRFSGYAYAQLKRIQRHRGWLFNPPKKKPERPEFGLPEKKLIRDEHKGAYEWLIAMLLKDSLEESNLSETTLKELNDVNYIGLVQREFSDDAWSTIQELTGATDEWVDTMMREKKYRAALSHWNSYLNWQKSRNPKRAEIEAEHGYDSKHAMHLVRLMRQGMEILKENEIHVYRPDREELKEIRNGAWTYEQVVEYAESCETKMKELYEESTLPKQPDRGYLDNLCCTIIEEWLEQ